MTNNLERRLDEHKLGYDPLCYTYSRRPVELQYSELHKMVNDAITREEQIKRWS
jgi:putative endonuclease